MSQLAFVQNFANPGFMAPMEPGCPLGDMIAVANGFMDVLPGDNREKAWDTVVRLGTVSERVPGMRDVFKKFTLPPSSALISDYRRSQERFQDEARPLFDEHLGVLTEAVKRGEAGIPFYRPGEKPLISAGLMPGELRRLMDYGLASPAPVGALAHELSSQLYMNLREVGGKASDLLVPIAVFSMVSALAAGGLAIASPVVTHSLLVGVVFSSAFLLLGITWNLGDLLSNWTPQERLALGLTPMRDHRGMLLRRLAGLDRLCQEYDRTFDCVDWRVRVAGGGVTP